MAKKKNPKYTLVDQDNNVIYEDTTKKNILDFFHDKIHNASDKDLMDFLVFIYGKEIVNVTDEVILHTLCHIVIDERFKKLIKKNIEFADQVYSVSMDK